MRIGSIFGQTYSGMLTGSDVKRNTVTKDRASKSFEEIVEDKQNNGVFQETRVNSTGSARIKSFNTGVPYEEMADENGIISYGKAVFVCDKKEQALCLGDMGERSNVLDIPLSGGGRLRVNRDNIEELMTAIGMFSPKDQEIIVRAVTADARCRNKKMQVEDQENKVFNQLADTQTGEGEEESRIC